MTSTPRTVRSTVAAALVALGLVGQSVQASAAEPAPPEHAATAAIATLRAELDALEGADRRKLHKDLAKVQDRLARFEFGKACRELDDLADELDEQVADGDVAAVAAEPARAAAAVVAEQLGCGVAAAVLPALDALVDAVTSLDPSADDPDDLLEELEELRARLPRYEYGKACRELDDFLDELAEQVEDGAPTVPQAAAVEDVATEVGDQLGCGVAATVAPALDDLTAGVATLGVGAKDAKKLTKVLDQVRKRLAKHELDKACRGGEDVVEAARDRVPAGTARDEFVAAVWELLGAMGCFGGDAEPPVEEGDPDVVVAKAASATSIAAGEQLTYTLTVGNVGDGSATDVVLTDQLDGSLTPVDAGWGGGDCAVTPGGEVTCALGVLPVGASVEVSVVVTADGGVCTTDVANVATVAASNEPLEAQDDNISGTVLVTIADDGACEPEGPDLGQRRAPPAGGALGTTSTWATGRSLYTGDEPTQVVADPTVFDPSRAGIVSGRVLDRAGVGIPGVRVELLHHSEVGHTTTTADGTWHLAVNGGGDLTVDLTADGLLPVQRTVAVQWQDWVVVEDVVMLPLDPAVTAIDLGTLAPGEVAVHSGTTVVDGDGTRTPHVLVAGGTTADVRLPDGSTAPAPDPLPVRVTEYTVGAAGPAAMPGELPPSSAYTYAAEFSVDGVPDGASVEFSQPVVTYLQDVDASAGTEFVGFPVGLAVPLGAYDRAAAAWEAEENGVVLGIVGEAGGVAQVDTTGDGVADDGVGLAVPVDAAERGALAALFDPGDTVWRTPVDHFTPLDLNHPVWTPEDPQPPSDFDPHDGLDGRTDTPFVETGYGSVEAEHQVLRERLVLPGAGQSLHYSSDRVPGRTRTVDVRLTGAELPTGLVRVEARTTVAGRAFATVVVAPSPNERWVVPWDGRDAFGRTVQGEQVVTTQLTYVYEALYAVPAATAAAFGLPTVVGAVTTTAGQVVARLETGASRTYRTLVGGHDARGVGLGGWTLTDHHAYDPRSGVVHRGDGTRQGAGALGGAVETVAGTGERCGEATTVDCLDPAVPADETPLSPNLLTVGADGRIHVVDDDNRLLTIDPDGTVTHLGGSGFEPGFCTFEPDAAVGGGGGGGGGGGPVVIADPCPVDAPVDARDVAFDSPSDIDVLPDGDLLLADEDDLRLFRIDPDTRALTVFAGNGEQCFDAAAACGDGGAARDATLHGYDVYVAVATDGTVYVSGGRVIRRIGTDGRIESFLGAYGEGCAAADCGDGGPAALARLGSVEAPMDVGPDGSLYLLDFNQDTASSQVRRVTPSGVVQHVGGGAAWDEGNCSTWDGEFGVDCSGTPVDRLHIGGFVEALEVQADGSVLLPAIETHEILRLDPDGIVRRVAGVGPPTSLFSGWPNDGSRADGVPGPFSEVIAPTDVAIGPDGTVVWAQGWFWGEDYRLRRLTPQLPVFDGGDLVVPAEDGSEVWLFDDHGRHLETRHGLTGATLRSFAYDAEGRLASSTDADGNVVSVLRDAGGQPTAVVGPFGDATAVSVDGEGWLADVTTPLGLTTSLQHSASGLLAGVQGARAGATYAFAYDEAGRLVAATDPGGTTTLAGTPLHPGVEVVVTSPEGRSSSHRVEQAPAGGVVRTTTHPDGSTATVVQAADGTATATRRDGTVTEARFLPHLRLGPGARLLASSTTTTPGGVVREETLVRAAVLADPDDPFSIVEETTERSINGRTTTVTHDGPTRTTTVVTPEGREVVVGTDATGRPTSSRVGDLAVTVNEYDARGRLCRVTASDGSATRETLLRYDPAGVPCGATGGAVPLAVVDPLGRASQLVWDADLRPVGATDPAGHATTFTYDAASNLVALTSPRGTTHAQSYDDRDGLAAYTPPGASTPAVTWTRGPDGLVERVDRSDGGSNDPTHDAAGRLAQRVTDHATFDRAYDAVGRLTALSSTVDTDLTYTYDGGLLLATTSTGLAGTTLAVTPNADLEAAAETVDAGMPDEHTVVYDRDDDGFVVGAGPLVVERDPATGLVVGTSLGDVTTTTTHTGFGQVETHVVRVAGTPILEASYQYDALGRVVGLVETVEGDTTTRAYTYDAAGRLVAVDEDGTVRSYAYDANGNRTSGPGGAAGTYDDRDRVLTYDDRTYVHDETGDLVSVTDGAGTTTYAYDVDGNLHAVDSTAGDDVAYALDARGRRVARTDAAGTTAWAYRDAVTPVAQYDAAGDRALRFVFGTTATAPDYLVDTTGVAPATHRVVTDHLGSPRLVVDVDTGAVVQRLDYDEFGRVTSDSNPGYQPFGFQGGLQDPVTGLVRFGARDYDPRTGRFTNRDPVLFGGGQVNLYEFVASDPVNATDPSGYGPGVSWWDAAKREAGYFRDGAAASGPQLVRATAGGAKVVGGLATTTAGVLAVETGVGAGPGVVMINMGLVTTGSGLADVGAAIVEGPDVSTSTFPATPITAAATGASPEVQAVATGVEMVVGGGLGRASGAVGDTVSGLFGNAGNVAGVIDTGYSGYSAVAGVAGQ